MKYEDPLKKELDKVNKEFEAVLKQSQRSFANVVNQQPKRNTMLIGENAMNGKGVFLSEDDRKVHMHIIGGSGAGKSKLMEHMIRSDIDNGRGLCLLDPHGSIYEPILKYVARKRYEDRLILIDPNDEEWAVGINYLEHDSARDTTSHASQVINGIAKVFGGENTDVMPRLQRWERNALIPLIEKRLTLVELSDFVHPESPFLRALILQEIENHQVLQDWEMFENSPARERINYVESVLNRANKFAAGNIVRRIFGQAKSTINFREAMDQGKIILCNLACTKLSDEEQTMLGVVIIDKIFQAAMSRMDIPESRRKPFYFYMDEFARYVSKDIARALTELRKFNVRLILAHQELEQLREDDRKVYSAVIGEPQVRLAFRVSREDAEILAKEMFTGKIRGDREKRRIKQTKFRPVETTRTIRSESENWSEGKSESTSHSESEGESYSESTTASEGESYNEPDIIIPFPDSPGGVIRISTSEATTRSSGHSSSSSRSSSSGSSSTQGGGSSTSEVPFYEFEEFEEVSSIQDYSIEEMVEKFIAWIKTQPDRRAQLKVKQRFPVPITTPFVKDLPVRDKDIQMIKEKVYSKYAMPAKEADLMIEQRRTDFLNEAEALGLVEPREPIELTIENMRHPAKSSAKTKKSTKNK